MSWQSLYYSQYVSSDLSSHTFLHVPSPIQNTLLGQWAIRNTHLHNHNKVIMYLDNMPGCLILSVDGRHAARWSLLKFGQLSSEPVSVAPSTNIDALVLEQEVRLKNYLNVILRQSCLGATKTHFPTLWPISCCWCGILVTQSLLL